MNKSKVFKKWLLSYVVFILCMTFFTLIIFSIFSNRMEQDVKNINKAGVDEIRSIFDEKIISINTLLNSIYLTPEFIKLFNASPDLSTLDYYNILEAQKTLRLHDAVTDISTFISVYLFKPQVFLNRENIYTQKHLSLLATEQYNLSTDELMDLLSGYYKEHIIRLSDATNSNMNKLVYLQSLPNNSINYSNATVMIELNEDEFSKYLGPLTNNDNSSVAIVNDQNHILYSIGEEIDLGWIDYDELHDIDIYNVTIDNSRYIAIISKSHRQNWLYIKVIPKNIFIRKTIILRNDLLVLLALLLATGITLAYIMAKKNYTPLNVLTKDILSPKDLLSTSGINEFELIKRQFDYKKEKQIILDTQLDKQNELLKKNFLTNFIKGRYTGIDEVKAQFETYEYNFSYDSFAVIAIKINDFSFQSYSGNIEEDYLLSTFIIHNIFKEISKDAFELYDTEDGDLIFYIINFGKDTLNTYSEFSNVLADILSETYGHLKDEFKIDFTSIISNVHKTVWGMQEAYRECLDALAYTKVLGNTKIIFYQETLQSKALYTYPIETEHRIINFIRASDTENAKKIIKEIVYGHRQNKQLSPVSIQFLYYDILGTVLKTITNQKEQELVEELKPLKALLQCDCFEEMDDILYNLLTSVCEIKKEKEEISSMDLHNNVREFIIRNLFNPDLNVAFVGDEFNITPAYLSKLFKNETGESILQTINRMRVEKSKDLLKDTSLTLEEIAERTGYLYPNTFIRIFKRYEGITPGQFRKTT